MKNLKKQLTLLTLFVSICVLSQGKVTISGTIYDKVNNETLIGVSIYFPELEAGTSTNEYGFYSITIPEGKHKLFISYIGYKTISKTLDATQKTTIDLYLFEDSDNLDEIIIKSNIEKTKIKTAQMSVNKLTSKTIKQIPVVLGEADIIKSIILLPGVTSAGEGASGFNVLSLIHI